MSFNKGYELKKFEAHWEKLRIEYLEQSPLRNIRQRALHITTWRCNFAAKLEIPTRRHLLHPFRGEYLLDKT